MAQKIYENDARERFFMFEHDTMEPTICRSALDAYNEVNGELQDKLNEAAAALFSVYRTQTCIRNKAAAQTNETMADVLNTLGFYLIEAEAE